MKPPTLTRLHQTSPNLATHHQTLPSTIMPNQEPSSLVRFRMAPQPFAEQPHGVSGANSCQESFGGKWYAEKLLKHMLDTPCFDTYGYHKPLLGKRLPQDSAVEKTWNGLRGEWLLLGLSQQKLPKVTFFPYNTRPTTSPHSVNACLCFHLFEHPRARLLRTFFLGTGWPGYKNPGSGRRMYLENFGEFSWREKKSREKI